MFNRTTIAPIVALIFFILAYLKVGLPDTMTQEAVVLAVLGIIGIVTVIARFKTGDEYAAGVKRWWQSKVIWLQIFGVITSLLGLFGVRVGVDPEAVAGIAAILVTGLTAIFGSGDQAKITSG